MALLLLLGAAQPLLLGVELGLYRYRPPLAPPSPPSPPPPPPPPPPPSPPRLFELAVSPARVLSQRRQPLNLTASTEGDNQRAFLAAKEEGGDQRTTWKLRPPAFLPSLAPPFEADCTNKLLAHFPFESPVLVFLYSAFVATRLLVLCLGRHATRNFGRGLRERVHLARHRQHDSSSIAPSESPREIASPRGIASRESSRDSASPDPSPEAGPEAGPEAAAAGGTVGTAGGRISGDQDDGISADCISATSAPISAPSPAEVASGTAPRRSPSRSPPRSPSRSPSRSTAYSVPLLEEGDRASGDRASGDRTCVPSGASSEARPTTPTPSDSNYGYTENRNMT